MTLNVGSVEEIVNLALDAIGYPERVADIYGGTKQEMVALRLYAQTRDALLRSRDWPFARRSVALAANGQLPPQPWRFEYAWPSDCLRLMYVRPALATGPILTVQPQRFDVFNDQRTSPPAKTIVANISPATAFYIGQITDMLTWEPLFTDALVGKLASVFAVALAGSADLLKVEEALAEAAELSAAETSETHPPGIIRPAPAR